MAYSEFSSRTILMFSDSWGANKDGIAAVNKLLATSLNRFKGLQIVNGVFGEPSNTDKKEAEENNVTLINLAPPDSDSDVYKKFNANPESFLQDVIAEYPNVSRIVGHSPITAEAAVRLSEGVYSKAKVVLFYHAIPNDIAWAADRLPFTVPSDSEQVQLAERAEIVYSVSNKVHWFYTAKFRNRAEKKIDHRLFLPQCPTDVFALSLKPPDVSSSVVILVECSGGSLKDWQGIDIAVCAVNKVAEVSASKPGERPIPSLIIGGIDEDQIEKTKESLAPYMNFDNLNVEFHSYNDKPKAFLEDLCKATLCLVPARAEPFGYVGLHALSCGIPTLIAKNSSLADVARRLSEDANRFLVPVTVSTSCTRQDGSVWRDRILSTLVDMEGARKRAKQLSTALRRDEITKDTHDNFVSHCLGGILLTHELKEIEFLSSNDKLTELPSRKAFNNLLSTMMKQCWRLKHHPLTTVHDLSPLIAEGDLPIQQLIKSVTDKIEDRDRRIIGIKNDSFLVYCPNPDSLSDLWAMCDRINEALTNDLLGGDTNPVLQAFRLQNATVRTIISGPEFLVYKQELIDACAY